MIGNDRLCQVLETYFFDKLLMGSDRETVFGNFTFHLPFFPFFPPCDYLAGFKWVWPMREKVTSCTNQDFAIFESDDSQCVVVGVGFVSQIGSNSPDEAD